MTTAMSEQNTHREAAVQQQQAAAQSRNLNAELQVLAKFGGYWWLAHFSRFCHLQIIDIQQYYETMYRDTNP